MTCNYPHTARNGNNSQGIESRAEGRAEACPPDCGDREMCVQNRPFHLILKAFFPGSLVCPSPFMVGALTPYPLDSTH